MRTLLIHLLITVTLVTACKKNQSAPPTTTTVPPSFSFNTLKINGAYNGFTYYNVNTTPRYPTFFYRTARRGFGEQRHLLYDSRRRRRRLYHRLFQQR